MPDAKPELNWDKVKKFSAHVSNDIGAAMLGAMSYIGDRLGIFKTLADGASITSVELAEKTGLNERYLREWLGAMTAAEYVNYDAASRRYSMPAENAMILAREESPFFMGGFIQGIIPNLSVTPKVLEAFRSGKGVRQSEYPPETFESMERSTASMYRNQLLKHWLPAIPNVVKTLQEGGSALDVGCGSGRCAITLAQTFPKAKIFGFDAHPGSLERARNNARMAGVSDRITFDLVDCTKLPTAQFDFISTFDVVHDSIDPVGLLRSIHTSLRPGG